MLGDKFQFLFFIHSKNNTRWIFVECSLCAWNLTGHVESSVNPVTVLWPKNRADERYHHKTHSRLNSLPQVISVFTFNLVLYNCYSTLELIFRQMKCLYHSDLCVSSHTKGLHGIVLYSFHEPALMPLTSATQLLTKILVLTLSPLPDTITNPAHL